MTTLSMWMIPVKNPTSGKSSLHIAPVCARRRLARKLQGLLGQSESLKEGRMGQGVAEELEQACIVGSEMLKPLSRARRESGRGDSLDLSGECGGDGDLHGPEYL